jgi:AcrR family transcriptional regulator
VPAPRGTTNDPDAAARARAAGRPLDEAVDTAILNAAWRLLLEEGYSRLSIAGVAQAAKVGRPAIYRRYKDKSELVAAVIADKVSHVPPIDTGNTRDDLVAHLELARRRFTVSLAGTLIVEERNHPELVEQFRNEMIVPRSDSIAEALERGKQRGEVRADLDSQIAAHALMGSFIFSYLAGGRPPKGWSERVVDTLWPAFAA